MILVTGSAGHLGEAQIRQPRHDFAHVLDAPRTGEDFRSPLTHDIGSKGYHAEIFAEGPYPVR